MSLDQVLQTAIPTLMIALVGWGLRTVIEDIRAGVKDLNTKVGGHGEKLATHDARISVLESERRKGRR